MVAVLLHLESLHTVLDDVQTGGHVQGDQEHVVLVSELSVVVVVDGIGSVVASACGEHLVLVKSEVFL